MKFILIIKISPTFVRFINKKIPLILDQLLKVFILLNMLGGVLF